MATRTEMALLTRISSAARDLIDDGGDVVAVGQLRASVGRAAACRDLVGDGRDGGADVGDGDVGAVGREYKRGGAAHAAGGTGNKDGQTFDQELRNPT